MTQVHHLRASRSPHLPSISTDLQTSCIAPSPPHAGDTFYHLSYDPSGMLARNRRWWVSFSFSFSLFFPVGPAGNFTQRRTDPQKSHCHVEVHSPGKHSQPLLYGLHSSKKRNLVQVLESSLISILVYIILSFSLLQVIIFIILSDTGSSVLKLSPPCKILSSVLIECPQWWNAGLNSLDWRRA